MQVSGSLPSVIPSVVWWFAYMQGVHMNHARWRCVKCACFVVCAGRLRTGLRQTVWRLLAPSFAAARGVFVLVSELNWPLAIRCCRRMCGCLQQTCETQSDPPRLFSQAACTLQVKPGCSTALHAFPALTGNGTLLLSNSLVTYTASADL
jgi:hypothetical protein